jgi:4'-phosphopantetheinyl transferase
MRTVLTWEAPPPRGPLPAGEVHVWRAEVDLAGHPIDALELLSPDERRRAATMQGPARARFVVGRATLRERLAAYGGIGPAEVAIAEGPTGKPEARAPAGVELSVAHSGGLVVLAFAREPVGVDVEAIRPRADVDALAARFFAASEHDAVRRAPDPLAAFLELWTVKEACLKATGAGLAGLATVAVSLAPGGPAVSVAGGGAWTAKTFCPAPGYVAAVVHRAR